MLIGGSSGFTDNSQDCREPAKAPRGGQILFWTLLFLHNERAKTMLKRTKICRRQCRTAQVARRFGEYLASGGRRHSLLDDCVQPIQIDGFDQVVIEASVVAFLD